MRRLPALVAALLLVLAVPAAAADGQSEAQRIGGEDRYATAAALARDGWRSASDAVVARGDDPADALAGSYVAGSHIGPVLLSEQRRVPQVTIDALKALGVHKVRLLGGESALGPEVEQQLTAAGFLVVRLAGRDRYATAAIAAADSGAGNVGVRNGRKAAILAGGANPADALAAGPLAYGQQWPVLLTGRDSLAPATATVLDDLGITHVVVVGGTAAVGDGVMAELERRGKVVERVAGADRERTAIALADLLVAYGQPLVEVEVASASSFADALALGPHAAPASPVLLCRSVATCGPETLAWITARSDAVDRIVIAGGTGAIGPTAEAELVLAAA